MKLIGLLLLCAISFVAGGCATGTFTTAQRLPKTIQEACNFYKTAKPAVVAYADWARKNWDAVVPGTSVPVIPGEQKQLLLQLNSYLPQLDALGVDVCEISELINAVQTGRKVGVKAVLANTDWDQVLSVVMKVASTAAQLKSQGAF